MNAANYFLYVELLLVNTEKYWETIPHFAWNGGDSPLCLVKLFHFNKLYYSSVKLLTAVTIIFSLCGEDIM